MAITSTPYAAGLKYTLDGTIIFSTDTLKCALVSSAYIPDPANHDEWTDVSAHEITGTAYTAGGKTLTNVTVSNTSTHGLVDADDAVWTGDTLTARYAVVYRPGTVNGKTNPLLFYLLLDDTPADFTSTNFTVLFNTLGVWRIG